MAYATPADFLAILRRDETSQLSQLDNPDEPLADPGTIERALEDASIRINSKIAARYTTPIVPSPPLLTQICVWTARYWMELGGEIREEVTDHYEASVADLNAIALGAMPLIASDGSIIPQTQDRDGTAPQTIGVVNRTAYNPWSDPRRRDCTWY